MAAPHISNNRMLLKLTCFVALLFLVFLPWLLNLHHLAYPSCIELQHRQYSKDPQRQQQLRVMVVADLHLAGPRTAWIDRLRRESFMKTSLKNAHNKLKPQMLVILGDVTDWGRKSTKEEWEFVVQRLDDILEPYPKLAVHVAVGNHDVGDFYEITPNLLQRFATSFPGLDATGSSIFMEQNIPFVSLNAMALACDACSMHSTMMGLAERASRVMMLQRPVLLLHLPLYRQSESMCNSIDTPRCTPWHVVEGNCLPLWSPEDSPHSLLPLVSYRNMMDMLSINTSTSLLSTLKPRLVVSAHTHRSCDRIHDDGTREITVSTFSWRNRDDPSFHILTFYNDGSMEAQHCLMARESLVLSLQGMLVFIALATAGFLCTKHGR